MYDTVAAAAPDQRRIFQILHKLTVNQHVNQVHHLHLRLIQLIKFIAGPDPDIFAGAFGAHALNQFDDLRDVLRMQRIAAGERKPRRLMRVSLRSAMIRSAISAVNGIPEFTRRAFVVAAGALVDAAGDKQGAAGAGAVDNIYRVVLMVIHFSLLN